MDPDTKLDIYGTAHVLSADRSIDQFRSFSAKSNAICIEEPRDRGGVKTQFQAMVRNPTVWLFFWVYGILTTVVRLINGGGARSFEDEIAERVASERPCNVYGVDCDPFRLASNTRLLLTPVSWGIAGIALLFGLYMIIGIVGLEVTQIVVGGGVSLLILSFATAPLIFRISDYRNKTMLENMQSIAEEHGYNRLCLVVGKEHLDDIEELAGEYGFEVVETDAARLWQ